MDIYNFDVSDDESQDGAPLHQHRPGPQHHGKGKKTRAELLAQARSLRRGKPTAQCVSCAALPDLSRVLHSLHGLTSLCRARQQPSETFSDSSSLDMSEEGSASLTSPGLPAGRPPPGPFSSQSSKELGGVDTFASVHGAGLGTVAEGDSDTDGDDLSFGTSASLSQSLPQGAGASQPTGGAVQYKYHTAQGRVASSSGQPALGAFGAPSTPDSGGSGDSALDIVEESVHEVSSEPSSSPSKPSLALAPSQPVPRQAAFREGDAVQAMWGGTSGGGEWYDGVVAGVHQDGTYRIHYNDGDVEEAVEGQFMRAAAAPPAATTAPGHASDALAHQPAMSAAARPASPVASVVTSVLESEQGDGFAETGHAEYSADDFEATGDDDGWGMGGEPSSDAGQRVRGFEPAATQDTDAGYSMTFEDADASVSLSAAMRPAAAPKQHDGDGVPQERPPVRTAPAADAASAQPVYPGSVQGSRRDWAPAEAAAAPPLPEQQADPRPQQAFSAPQHGSGLQAPIGVSSGWGGAAPYVHGNMGQASAPPPPASAPSFGPHWGYPPPWATTAPGPTHQGGYAAPPHPWYSGHTAPPWPGPYPHASPLFQPLMQAPPATTAATAVYLQALASGLAPGAAGRTPHAGVTSALDRYSRSLSSADKLFKRQLQSLRSQLDTIKALRERTKVLSGPFSVSSEGGSDGTGRPSTPTPPSEHRSSVSTDELPRAPTHDFALPPSMQHLAARGAPSGELRREPPQRSAFALTSKGAAAAAAADYRQRHRVPQLSSSTA